MSESRVIHIQPEAPPKPGLGAPCNGCGVCCLAEPCPLGVLLSRRRRGACVALTWDGAQSRYQCGALLRAQARPAWLAWPAVALLKRWIAAGAGCDAEWEAQPLP